jgi:hypothetical protein
MPDAIELKLELNIDIFVFIFVDVLHVQVYETWSNCGRAPIRNQDVPLLVSSSLPFLLPPHGRSPVCPLKFHKPQALFTQTSHEP